MREIDGKVCMKLPDYVKKIIDALESAGYEAYAVGGCVRDSLLGLTPDDYDVTTSATPDEMKKSLMHEDFTIHDTGLQHGTVTVVVDDSVANKTCCSGEQRLVCEVTTFRVDGEYSDNRRPDSVTFTRSLREDMSRRDFTVNAMAYSEKAGLCDYFGGRRDLDNKLIRAVGEPHKRFGEDGLRILRALRFAGVYGFSVEENTAAAVRGLKGLIKGISGERIAAELNKLVMGEVSGVIYDYAEVFAEFISEIADCKDFDQRSVYHDRDVLTHTLNALDSAPRDKVTRLALLFHDLGKPACFRLIEDADGGSHGSFKGHPAVSEQIARRVMRSLKYDNDTFYKVATLVKFHDIPVKADVKSVKCLLNRFGEEMFFRLIDVHIADYSAKRNERAQDITIFREAAETAKRIIAENQCFSLERLAVKGGDLVALGFKGREVGEKLELLLHAVISEKCVNDKEVLIEFLRNPTKEK
ncbi:MAG: HD domain-containing protein [Oscillospiraceae bacterium]|nr:HD domain-containing protein [Oscillospiraceae bacterium]